MIARRRLIGVGTVAVFGGCALGPTPVATVYDFGPPPEPPGTGIALRTLRVSSPPWLETTSILYRLEYLDAAQLAAYRDSRWAAHPAALFAERLRQRAARSGRADMAGAMLAVELEEFAHVFNTPTRSRGVVRLRVLLHHGDTGRVLHQQPISIQQEAASPDARGGAHALAQAADDAIDQILRWSATAGR